MDSYNKYGCSDKIIKLYHGSKSGIHGKESEQNRSFGIASAELICRQYRRTGRFFDEILEADESL